MEIIVLPPITIFGRSTDPVEQAYAAGQVAATGDTRFHLNGPMMEALANNMAALVMAMARSDVSAAFLAALGVPSMGLSWAVLAALHGINATNRIADARINAILNLGVIPNPDLHYDLTPLGRAPGATEDLPLDLAKVFASSTVVMTDVERETVSRASFAPTTSNPGAGWGGFSPTNEGGRATINSDGKISWAGMNHGPIGITGAQSQFSNNASLAQALASLLGSIFGGRTDTGPPAPPSAPPETPDPGGPY